MTGEFDSQDFQEIRSAQFKGSFIGISTLAGFAIGVIATFYICRYFSLHWFAYGLVGIFVVPLSTIALGLVSASILLVREIPELLVKGLVTIVLLGGSVAFSFCLGPWIAGKIQSLNHWIGYEKFGYLAVLFYSLVYWVKAIETKSNGYWVTASVVSIIGCVICFFLGRQIGEFYGWFSEWIGNALVGYVLGFFLGAVAIGLPLLAIERVTGLEIFESEKESNSKD